MKIHYKIVLPIIYILVTIFLTFFFSMGLLLTVAMGLPWTFVISFITGLLYHFFPNIPGYFGMIIMIVPSLAINFVLLYILGEKIDNKIAKNYEQKT